MPGRRVLRNQSFQKAEDAERAAARHKLAVRCGLCNKLRPWTEINFQDWAHMVWTAECNKCHGLSAEGNDE
jgi:hypothetical protein